MTQHTFFINEALWCDKDAPVYKSYSPDKREHACLETDPSKNHSIIIFENIKIAIPAKIVTGSICSNNCNMMFLAYSSALLIKHEQKYSLVNTKQERLYCGHFSWWHHSMRVVCFYFYFSVLFYYIHTDTHSDKNCLPESYINCETSKMKIKPNWSETFFFFKVLLKTEISKKKSL